MSKTARALRATSDALLRDLERLAAIEHEKRTLPPDDPRLVQMAAEVTEIAARVLDTSNTQHELTLRAEELVQRRDRDAPTAPIAATPREMSAILSDWREAEREAAAVDADSPEAREIEGRIERLRAEYRDAHRRLNGESAARD